MIKELPEKLRALREQNGLSQRSVANKLEISPSIVSSYESGDRTPSTEVLLKLSYLYRCSTDYLLGRDAVPPGRTIDAAGLSNEEIEAVINLIRIIKARQTGKN